MYDRLAYTEIVSDPNTLIFEDWAEPSNMDVSYANSLKHPFKINY